MKANLQDVTTIKARPQHAKEKRLMPVDEKVLREDARIVIHGAGSIGCFIGGLLFGGGRRVVLVARPSTAEELGTSGLRLTDFRGLDASFAPHAISIVTSPAALSEADLVLLTVKSGATATAAGEIGDFAPKHAPVVSLQNGVDNVRVLTERLAAERVIGGVVGFNIVHKGPGHFHRATSGGIIIGDGRPDILRLLSVPNLPVTASSDIEGVQWGKLIVNLNNALNALSNLPLKQQLKDAGWRRVLAAQIAEAVAVLRAAGIRPISPAKAPFALIAPLLKLPAALFSIAARSMLAVDPEARSSMWDDLMRKRRTEIDYLQGAIIRLAKQHGAAAPISEK